MAVIAGGGAIVDWGLIVSGGVMFATEAAVVMVVVTEIGNVVVRLDAVESGVVTFAAEVVVSVLGTPVVVAFSMAVEAMGVSASAAWDLLKTAKIT